MDDFFNAILVNLKKLLADEHLPEDLAPGLTQCFSMVAQAYETTIDRRIEAHIGKEKYQHMLAMAEAKEGIQGLVQSLPGATKKGDLPN